MKPLLLIPALLITIPASANHGIEAMGDGLVDIVKFALLFILVGLVFVVSVVLRFALNKRFFSIGVYLSGCVVVLFTLKNYFGAIEEYDARFSISDSYPRTVASRILERAEDQLLNAALLFYFILALLLVYVLLDILAARKKRRKQQNAQYRSIS